VETVQLQQRHLFFRGYRAQRRRVIPVRVDEFARRVPFPTRHRRRQNRRRPVLARLPHEAPEIVPIGAARCGVTLRVLSFSSLCPNWMITKSPVCSAATTLAQRPSSMKLLVLRPFIA